MGWSRAGTAMSGRGVFPSGPPPGARAGDGGMAPVVHAHRVRPLCGRPDRRAIPDVFPRKPTALRGADTGIPGSGRAAGRFLSFGRCGAAPARLPLLPGAVGTGRGRAIRSRS